MSNNIKNFARYLDTYMDLDKISGVSPITYDGENEDSKCSFFIVLDGEKVFLTQKKDKETELKNARKKIIENLDIEF